MSNFSRVSIKDPTTGTTAPVDSNGLGVGVKSSALPTGAAQDDSITLLRRIVKLLEPMAVTDTSQRQRVAIDSVVAGITTLGVSLNGPNAPSSLGAPAASSMYWQPVWIGPVDQRWEMIDRARMGYNEGIRSHLSW